MNLSNEILHRISQSASRADVENLRQAIRRPNRPVVTKDTWHQSILREAERLHAPEVFFQIRNDNAEWRFQGIGVRLPDLLSHQGRIRVRYGMTIIRVRNWSRIGGYDSGNEEHTARELSRLFNLGWHTPNFSIVQTVPGNWVIHDP